MTGKVEYINLIVSITRTVNYLNILEYFSLSGEIDISHISQSSEFGHFTTIESTLTTSEGSIILTFFFLK